MSPTGVAFADDDESSPEENPSPSKIQWKSVGGVAKSMMDLKKETVLETMYALLFRIEAERQEQRLAHLYYSKWHYWMLFLPAALLTMFSSILAFLGQTDRYQCTPTGSSFGIIVGCLAVVATFLQALANHLAYGTSADMHKAAAIDLQEMSDALKFDVLQTSLVDDSNKQTGVVLRYRGLYEQVMKGTKSVVPLKISQAFDLVDARLDSIVEQAEKYDIDPNSTQVNDFMIDCVTMLYCELTVYTRYTYIENKKWWKFWQYFSFPWNSFPWVIPDPETAVKKALGAVCEKNKKLDHDVTNYLKSILLDEDQDLNLVDDHMVDTGAINSTDE